MTIDEAALRRCDGPGDQVGFSVTDALGVFHQAVTGFGDIIGLFYIPLHVVSVSSE